MTFARDMVDWQSNRCQKKNFYDSWSVRRILIVEDLVVARSATIIKFVTAIIAIVAVIGIIGIIAIIAVNAVNATDASALFPSDYYKPHLC